MGTNSPGDSADGDSQSVRTRTADIIVSRSIEKAAQDPSCGGATFAYLGRK